MSATKQAKRVAPFAEELLENRYARDNLEKATKKLRAAYKRSQKRRVKAARDERIRRQIQTAGSYFSEAAGALTEHREHPKRHWGRWLLIGAAACGIAIAARSWASSSRTDDSSINAPPGA